MKWTSLSKTHIATAGSCKYVTKQIWSKDYSLNLHVNHDSNVTRNRWFILKANFVQICIQTNTMQWKLPLMTVNMTGPSVHQLSVVLANRSILLVPKWRENTDMYVCLSVCVEQWHNASTFAYFIVYTHSALVLPSHSSPLIPSPHPSLSLSIWWLTKNLIGNVGIYIIISVYIYSIWLSLYEDVHSGIH